MCNAKQKNMGVLIIAEAGVNHNGDINLAKEMIDTAKDAGADVVKFQTFIPEELVVADAEMAVYQKKNIGKNEKQIEMLRRMTLQEEEYRELKRYCDMRQIEFCSTPFDLKSIAFLNEFDMPFWKIPSGEITNVPYLIKIAETRKPIVMSTGMCTIDEVEFALEILKSYGATEITLLHCNTEYPTPFEDVNLNAMNTLRTNFDCKIGYSDHTIGIEVPIAAVAMGAEVIEKHFTLDKNMEGPDHKASLEPKELKCMVEAIRNIEVAMGDGQKKASNSEEKNLTIARKSVVASRNIKRGELLTPENITVKRPGDGISAAKWFDVIGRIAVANFAKDEKIYF